MRHFALCRGKSLHRTCLVVAVGLLFFAGLVNPAAQAEQQKISGAVKSGSSVAATPISIPRPIRLEKIVHLQLPVTDGQQQLSTTLNIDPAKEAIESCEIVAIKGKEVTLKVHYRFTTKRSSPVFAGAFIYDAKGQSVNAGYKPVSAPRAAGDLEITLVLPSEAFRAHHIVAFFLESARPVFMNARFRFPYVWQHGVLSAEKSLQPMPEARPTASPLVSNKEFCEEYARQAVAQFTLALARHLPGIVPPVWSGDSAHHYKWCLKADREGVKAGTSLRQSHIDRYSSSKQGVAADTAKGPPAGVTAVNPASDAGIVSPIPKKQFDPGRGP